MTHDTNSDGAGAGAAVGRLAIMAGAGVAVLIAGVVVAFLLFDKVGVSGFERTEDTVLFPELRERRDEIAALTVSTVAESFEIRRSESGWVLADRGGYPVPAEKVEAILEFLDGLLGLYASTVEDSDYGQYRVAMPDESEAGAGQTIRIVDGDGSVIAEFTIGITLSVPTDDGVASLTAVRRGRDARIRLVDDTISLPQDATAWLDRGVVDIAAADIVEFVIQPPEGDPFPITRNEEGALMIAGERTRSDLASPWVLDQVMASLQTLSFVDVRKSDDAERRDPQPWVVTVTTAPGLRYTLEIHQLGSTHWTTLQAEATESGATEEAESFNARHGGWAYRLPPSTIDRIKNGPSQLR